MSRNFRSIPTDERTDESSRTLVVVSNRQPYSHEYDADGRPTVDRPTGGLTAGLDPVMKRVGGAWIAWGDGEADADVVDENGDVSVPPEDPEYRLRRVWLTDEQVRDYYYGFSNQVLWPLCHGALTNVRCDPAFWRRYRRVNERFADAVVDAVDERSVVWFQDYHLALAPRLVRHRLPEDTRVMGFWHIPWPAWDTFRACPHGRELIEGILGNDVFGVHVPRYRDQFLECADAAVDDAHVDWDAGTVTYMGRTTSVEATPMGVPVDDLRQAATSPTAERFGSTFRAGHDVPQGATIAVGVDRLDYTKGIVERLRAFERLWEQYPKWRGSLTYVQKGSESRSRIPAYRAVQDRVAELVGRIDARFGTDDWQPVIYTTEHLSEAELCGLYRCADVGTVSPIRDGMNLVAQEYVAAQVEHDGVLLLSDQAGVHDEVGDHAVTVTPSDTQAFADAIADALTMPREERRRRMTRLRRWVVDNDLDAWVRRSLPADVTAPSPDTRTVSQPGRGGGSSP